MENYRKFFKVLVLIRPIENKPVSDLKEHYSYVS